MEGKKGMGIQKVDRKNNRYFGKRFSILGDSISTFEGYNPCGYKVFYNGENCIKSGVIQVEDTWWNHVIRFLGGELLINNSWSGSRVTKLPEIDQLFPSGCSDERTSNLHIGNETPDVIIVYLGTNDWAFGAATGNDTCILNQDPYERFDDAYLAMLRKIKKNYPQSEVWCCTLNTTFMSGNIRFQFPYSYGGNHIEEYNEIIRCVARENQCSIIDLYVYNQPYDTLDGTHPNRKGMKTLSQLILREIDRAGAAINS